MGSVRSSAKKPLKRVHGEFLLRRLPYDKLKSLPLAESFLKPGITFQQLDAQANAISDNEAAQRLNNARTTLFKTISNRSKSAA